MFLHLTEKNMMNGDVVTDFVSYPDNLTLKGRHLLYLW